MLLVWGGTISSALSGCTDGIVQVYRAGHGGDGGVDVPADAPTDPGADTLRVACTGAVTSMYGLSSARSKYADACDDSTAGANGRKLSRNLILSFMMG